MASTNDITGDKLKSKVSNQAYDDGYDRIFSREAKEKLKTVEERKGPCQLHDACTEEKNCACLN